MKKSKKAGSLILVLSFLLITSNVFTNSSGPPAGKTNAPGESNCTDCHGSYSLVTSGTVWNAITLSSNMPASSYALNTTYTITISASYAGIPRFGFQVCVLPASATSSSVSVGSIIVTDAINSQTQTSGGRQYINHTSSGYVTTAGAASWSFNWHSPSTNQGSVKFYVVLNAVDNDNSSSGDEVFAKTFTFNALPVKWLSVKSTQKDNLVSINWSTASESNNDHFDVERSNDGKNFSSLGTVKAVGNTSSISNYSFNDFVNDGIKTTSSNKFYYRIKQTDIDGKTDYSDLTFVDFKPTLQRITISPNPVATEITLSNHGNSNEILPCEIYNTKGEMVWNGTLDASNKNIDISGLERGIYFLKAADEKPTRFIKL